jgi:hypothetical protein
MADGSQKVIENVKIGDEIFSYDLEKNEKVVSIVGELESPVREGFYNVELESGKVLGITNEHPVYIKKSSGEVGWGSIIPEVSRMDGVSFDLLEVKAGDMIFNNEFSYDKILSISYEEGSVQVYNLKDVGEESNFFADGFLAHNKK